jgi:hypothetical protein
MVKIDLINIGGMKLDQFCQVRMIEFKQFSTE